MFLKPVCVCFTTKQVVLFIEAVRVSTPYCLPSLLATANQMSRFGGAPNGSRVYRRTSRVYEQYTPQGHPMGKTVLQYYIGGQLIQVPFMETEINPK